MLTIRCATIKDIGRLTDLHCRSFKPDEHVPMMLGRNYVTATYKWQVSSELTYVLIAEVSGQLAGLVAVCDRSFTKEMFIACLPEFIKSLLLKPNLLFNKMLWMRLFRSPDIVKGSKSKVGIPGFAQMTIGAVDQSFRGKGIFAELVQATREYSHRRGSKAIRAGVYKRNQSSIRVFVKSGWKELKELETTDTVFYAAFFDKSIAEKFGIKLTLSHSEN